MITSSAVRPSLLLTASELRLWRRDAAAVIFTVGFPTLLMVILAGVFGTHADPDFAGVRASDYYVADYVVVPIAAALVLTVPVNLASYRENRVLRRYQAIGVGAGSVVAAQVAAALVLVTAGIGLELGVAAGTYGVPPVDSPHLVVLGMLAGTAMIAALGVLLGLLARTARSAQAVGLLVFFPMWLLGAGGPTRAVMPEGMGAIADLLPLGNLAVAVRDPWLGTGDGRDGLVMVLGWLVVTVVAIAAVGTGRRFGRVSASR